MLLDQVTLQNQRFQLTVHHDGLNIADMGYQSDRLRRQVLRVLEILPETVSQIDSLSDIYYIPRGIFHQINAGILWYIF